jgi:hypothetical protein
MPPAQYVLLRFRLANRARLCVIGVWTLGLLWLLPGTGIAQEQMLRASDSESSLPDAPMPQPERSQNGETSSAAQGAANVAGTVRDASGAVVPNAQVSLGVRDGSRLQTMKSDANGQFTFTKVAPGSYQVMVEAAGFAPFTSKELTIGAQQTYVVHEISLSVASSATSIVVRPTEVMAAQQIKAEEQQRFFGIVPNFYVSYVPDAAPLTSKQKFSLAAHDTFDWTSFLGVSVGAGIQQALNAHSGYGQGAAGYGKRWGALFADGRSSDLLSHYVFTSLLHQDPRYFYQGTGTKKSRFYHALSYAFVARNDSGRTMPNYSYLLGDLGSGALSNAYYPPADRGASLVFTNAALGIAGRAEQGLFQEFIANRLTKPEPCKIEAMQGPHATAVVYRYRTFVGSGIRASIYVDDKKVCSLYSGKYIVIPVTPGEHKLRGSDPKHGVMQKVSKEGFVYYFRVMVQPTSPFQLKNFWVMIPVPPETAQSELKALTPQPGEEKPLPNVGAPIDLRAPEIAK